MRETGTLRVDAGSPAIGAARGPDGPELVLDDGAGNRVSVRAIDGFLHVSGTGNASLHTSRGRHAVLRRRADLGSGMPVLVVQGMRVFLQAGPATARLAYDPDGLLPLPLRAAALAARCVDMPLPVAAVAACAAMGLVSLASVYWGGLPAGGTPLELARHRAQGGYPNLGFGRADWLAQRSGFMIETSERLHPKGYEAGSGGK